uniref:THO complex subunit 5 homolog n=2 Tax=Schistocephalus solidus TaxID=70667 RepID=A0A0X3PQP0_SCHSO
MATANEGLDNINKNVDLKDGFEELKNFKSGCTLLREAINLAWQAKKAKEKVTHSTFGKVIMNLKASNRRTQFKLKELRDATYQKKLLVDQQHRQLQNLLYELAHIEGSIQTCLEFKSLHDGIDLIPLEEYYESCGNQHPAESQHQETLNRLYWELEQRKRLHSSLNEMSRSVESITKTIDEKQKYLDGLADKLKDIVEFTKPLDSEMGLNIHESEENYQTAFLLPAPLYIIYSHLITFVECKELQPRAKVFIEGDSDLARSVNTTGIPRSDEGDADPSELEEHERPAAKRKGRHKSKTVAELGDQAASKHDIPHPLSVCVRISEEPSLKCPNFTLIIRFSWLRKSNLVSVQTYFEQPEFLDPLSQTGRDLLESENLLSGLEFAVLESADTPGQVLPLSRLAMDSPEPSFLPKLPPSQLGRAFMWAQQLAGLQCLPSLPSAIATGALRWEKRPIQQAAAGASVDGSQSVQPSTFGFIDTWFSAVMRRVQSRLLLNSELRAIEDGILNLSEHQKPFFPITEEIGLRTWDRITLDELKSWPRAETFIALDLIQPSDAIFQCQMTYRNRDTLSIGVAIPPCYPDEPSLIILGSVIEPFPTKDITVLHIQELETEVNCFWRELPPEEQEDEVEEAEGKGKSERTTRCSSSVPSPPENLLSCQLARLASCLPLLWAAPNDPGALAALRGKPGVRYRTRSRPLRFLPKFGVFTYR